MNWSFPGFRRAYFRLRGIHKAPISLLATALAIGVAVSVVAVLPGLSAAPAGAATTSSWQVSGASYELPLTIQDPGSQAPSSSSPLTDFPVKVVLTPSNFNYADDAGDTNGNDLAFVLAGDDSDTQLPYQVDTWDPNGTSVIWVQIPSLSSVATTLNLYYGQGGTYTGSNPAAVWSNDYNAVNLFNLSSGSAAGSLPTVPANPSTSGLTTGTVFPDVLGGANAGATLQNNGATSGSYLSTAALGWGGGSSSAGQAVNLSGRTGTSSNFGGTFMTLPAADGDPDANGDLTESMTVYVPAAALSTSSYLMTQQAGTPAGAVGEMFFQISSGKLAVSFYASTSNTGQGKVSDSNALSAGWHVISATVSGTTATVYVDGVSVGATTDSGNTAMGNALLPDPTAPIFVGEESAATLTSGSTSSSKTAVPLAYSQLSFADTARSAAWVQADYLSQTNQLISFGQTLTAATPVQATASGNGNSVTVSWQAPISTTGVTGYEVLEGTTAGGESATPVQTVSGADATSATVAGLTPGTYYFTVAAVLSGGGASVPSNEVSYDDLQSPSGVNATAYYSGTKVAVSWSAVSGASSYSVYEGTTSGDESLMPAACVALTATSCLIDDLTPGDTYYFTVEANGSSNSSVPSSEATTTTPASDTTGNHWQINGAPARLSLSVADDNLVAELDEFPVKVVLTPGNFNYAADAADGQAADASSSDLAFVQGDDSATTPTQLPYDVDTWNPGGTSVLWVLVPILPEFEPAPLELYYGPGGSYHGADAAGTWSNGFTAVNLFNTAGGSPLGNLPAAPQGPSASGLTTGTVFPDTLGGAAAGATLQNNGGTSGNFMSAAVLGTAGSTNAGQAVDLSGVTDASSFGGEFMTLPAADGDPSADGQLTESMTVYVPSSAITTGTYLMTQQANTPAGAVGEMFFQISSGKLAVSFYATDSNIGQGKITDNTALTPGWHVITATADGSTDAVYVDGGLVGTSNDADNTAPSGPLLANPTAPIFLGEESGATTASGTTSSSKQAGAFAYGQVSFSDVARGAAWAQADYQSQTNNLITYGQSQSPTTPLSTALTGTGATGTATVSWQSPVDTSGITGYEVLEGSSSGGESATPVATVGVNATSATVNDLNPGVSYFTVVAETAGGSSLPSNEVSYNYLLPPSSVTATAVSDTSVALDWSSAAGALSYSVYQGSSAGSEGASPVACTALTATSCLVTGLTAGNTYYFTVGDAAGGYASAPSSAEAAATPGSQDAWAVPAAQDRLPITLNASSLGSDLTDFPVQVQLTSSFDYADASPSTLEFMLGGRTTPLPYQVIHWNPGGFTTIWVQVPTLAPAGPPLYMYYNGVTATPPSTSVWDADFLGVYSFGDSNGTTIPDETVNGNDGQITYGSGSTGTVQLAQTDENGGTTALTETAGNDANISFGDLGQDLQHFTYAVSVGVDAADVATGVNLQAGGRQASTGVAPGEQFAILDDSGTFVPEIQSGSDATTSSTEVYQGDGNGGATQTTPGCTYPIPTLTGDWNWFNLAITYDGSSLDFYVNGTSICTVPFTGPVEPGSLPFSVGSFADGADYGDFAWDEMRLSDVARSADWIAAENLAESGQMTSNGSPQVDFRTTGALIDGTAQVGQTLTADTSGFSPAAPFYSYQWYDDGQPIVNADGSNATGSTLQLTPALLQSGAVKVGDQITVQITATIGSTTLSPTSAPVTLTAGQFSPGTATVSGPAQVGGTLTANPGSWSPAGSASYQWLRNGQPIAGATSATYTPTAGDFGSAITVQVTETADGYTAETVVSASVTIGYGTLVAGTPTIAGTVQVGQTVSVGAGTWAPVGAPSYQWLLDGNPIGGATGSTYTITADDAGHELSVEASEQPDGYLQESASSAAFEVENGVFTGGTVTISQAVNGNITLTATLGGWSPSPTTVAYQWLRNGTPIPGATDSTYTVPADTAGDFSVTVHVGSAGFDGASATSAAVVIAVPDGGGTGTVISSTAAPSMSGQATVGSTVMAQPGSWSESPSSVAYQWLLDGSAIPNATGQSYTIAGTAAGHSLSVQVTATAADGSASVNSDSTTVAKGTLTVRKKPAIKGKLAAGKTLKVSVGSWGAKPQLVMYQWLRNGKPIKHATRASFKVPAADVKAQLRVRVTVEATGYKNLVVKTAVAKKAKSGKHGKSAHYAA